MKNSSAEVVPKFPEISPSPEISSVATSRRLGRLLQRIPGWDDLARAVQREGVRRTLRRIGAFLGPAFLISVGYKGPGNWATDLEGGAHFSYNLL